MKILNFSWAILGLVYLLFLLVQPVAAQQVPISCDRIKIKSLIRIPPVSKGMDSKPEISVATKSTLPRTARHRKKRVTLVLTGPVFGSMDSSEIKNSLVCTKTGFNVTTIVIRGADFTGAVRNNTLWQPQTEVIFEYTKRQVTVEATWKIVLDTGLEVERDLHIPQQSFPTTIEKVIR